MRYNLDIKEVLGVRDTDKYRGSNDTKEKELRDRCRSEAGGDHSDGWGPCTERC